MGGATEDASVAHSVGPELERGSDEPEPEPVAYSNPEYHAGYDDAEF